MCNSTGVVRVYSRDYICSNYTMYTAIKCLSKHCQNGETKEEADGQKAEKTKKQKTAPAQMLCVCLCAEQRTQRSMQIFW